MTTRYRVLRDGHGALFAQRLDGAIWQPVGAFYPSPADVNGQKALEAAKAAIDADRRTHALEVVHEEER